MKIGELEVLRDSRQVTRNGSVVKVSNRAFDLLQLLIDANGALVSTEDIMAKVWPSTIVEENNIQVHVSALRRVLGERRELLQTVTGRGYRLSSTQWETVAPPPTVGDALHLPPRHIDHALPEVHGTLFGRTVCMKRIEDALTGTAPVVTLTGPVGVGKSRLAIETGHRWRASGVGTVSYLSLAALSHQRETLDAIATALEGLDDTGASYPSAAGAHPRVLLIIDNGDRAHDAVIEALRYSAAYRERGQIATIVTTRTPLRMSLENVVLVRPLSTTPHPHGDAAALHLFVAHVRALNPCMDLSPDFHARAHQVIEQMDGLPLALEFAAHHTALLGIETVCHLLAQDVDLQSQDLRRQVEKRHTSLHAALMWTWTDLGLLPRAILAALAEVSREVTADELHALALKIERSQEDRFDAIDALVESWFVFRAYRETAVTYWIPHTVRRFLRQQSQTSECA